MLKPGDIIEVGTVAFVFNGGDPDKPSNPAPFGMGLGVAELMDTLCTDGIRPSVYSKKQAARKSEFAMRVRNRQIREEQAEEDADLPSFAYSAAEARKSQEWAELDMEVQIAEAQGASLRDWRAPIFNPSLELFQANNAAAAVAHSAAITPSNRLSATSDGEYGLDPLDGQATPRPRVRASIDEEVESRVPVRKPAPQLHSADGCVFIPYTKWDGFKDALSERITTVMAFVKLNPSIGGAVALVAMVILFATLKFAPIGNSGPHIYVPPAVLAETPANMPPAIRARPAND